jgi:hypothetical protein
LDRKLNAIKTNRNTQADPDKEDELKITARIKH